MIEEPHLADADGGGTAALLFLAERAGPARCHARDASLAASCQQVRNLPPLAGPPGHRSGSTVLKIVRVRHDGHGPVPVLSQRLHRLPFGRRYGAGYASAPGGQADRPLLVRRA